MKCFSLLVVLIVKCVEDKCVQQVWGQEYVHTLDCPVNYSDSVLFS